MGRKGVTKERDPTPVYSCKYHGYLSCSESWLRIGISIGGKSINVYSRASSTLERGTYYSFLSTPELLRWNFAWTGLATSYLTLRTFTIEHVLVQHSREQHSYWQLWHRQMVAISDSHLFLLLPVEYRATWCSIFELVFWISIPSYWNFNNSMKGQSCRKYMYQ